MATSRFDVVKNCLTVRAFKISANTISVNTFMSYGKCSKCLPQAFILSPSFSKTWNSLILQKIFPVFSSATFRNWFLALDEAFRKASCVAVRTVITAGGSNLEN